MSYLWTLEMAIEVADSQAKHAEVVWLKVMDEISRVLKFPLDADDSINKYVEAMDSLFRAVELVDSLWDRAKKMKAYLETQQDIAQLRSMEVKNAIQ